jgi:hypothetical protein
MIRSNISKIARSARAILRPLALSDAAKAEMRRDARGLPILDLGTVRAIDEGVAWLGRAQDCSASADGGVARHYSLLEGWGRSYPETTGYIVPTMLAYARRCDNDEARRRAKRMLDWLVSLQLANGGFQGGKLGRLSPGAVTFNTGQILIGLASGAQEFESYRQSMCRAADWLVHTQDADGCWRKYPTPFAAPGEKAYETHVAWGLLEAARVEPQRGYADAALANVRWSLTHQRQNGWFEACCLNDPSQPLTHTLGYALRGVVEAYRFTNDDFFLNAAHKSADGLMSAMSDDGFLPGRLRSDWGAAVPWACLTGSAQVACCWLLLYQATGDTRYRDAAFAVNRYVRRTMKIDGPLETRGAIKGSFPISGQYGAYQYLNWACKFFVDANMLELKIRQGDKVEVEQKRHSAAF